MSDIFREVEEDLRHERFRKLWDHLGIWVIALAILIVLGTAGYQGWKYYREQQGQAAGDQFLEAMQLAEDGKLDESTAALQKLSDATGGYPVLARFRMASDLGVSGKTEDAIAAYKALAADKSVDSGLRGLADIRAGYLALDGGNAKDVAALVQPLTQDNSPWRFAAREILAFSAWKEADVDAARKWVNDILDDAGAPRDISARANVLNELILAAHGPAATKAAGDAAASPAKAGGSADASAAPTETNKGASK